MNRTPSSVTAGFGWDPQSRLFFPKNFDLELSALLVGDGRLIGNPVTYANKQSADGAVAHECESTTGIGESGSFDELMTADLARVGKGVEAVIFAIVSRHGQPLNSIDGKCFDLVESLEPHTTILAVDTNVAATGMLVAMLFRTEGDWLAAEMGLPYDAKSIDDLVVPALESYKVIIELNAP